MESFKGFFENEKQKAPSSK